MYTTTDKPAFDLQEEHDQRGKQRWTTYRFSLCCFRSLITLLQLGGKKKSCSEHDSPI